MEPGNARIYSSVVIIKAEHASELLCAVYDSTYPLTAYRGRANLLGGNRDAQDAGPEETLLRELREEFSGSAPGQERSRHVEEILGEHRPPEPGAFANEEDIDVLRETIIKRIKPYASFSCRVPSFPGGPRQPYTVTNSVFIAVIPRAVFEMARKNIIAGRGMLNEGHLFIAAFDELARGTILTAHDSGVVLSASLGIELPNPEHVSCRELGKVAERYPDGDQRRP